MVMNARYTLLTLLASPALAQNWATYPQVPQTASINGFADPIFAKLPECAQSCVKESTGNTPCPYWDTGCLCIMPQWIDPVADCFAKNCKGSDAGSASSLANSLCKSVGAWWGIDATASTLLASAIGDAAAGGATTAAAATSAAATAAESTAESTPASTAAAPASSASSAATTAAATTAATAAASTAASSAQTSAAASSKSAPSAAKSSAASQKPPSQSNNGAAATIAVAGAVVAVVAHML